MDCGETLRAKIDGYAHRYYYQDSDFAVVERLSAIAGNRGASNSQIALAWILHQPGISAPIIGASRMHHLDEAIAVLDIKLDADELKALGEPYRPRPVLGHF